MVIKVSKETVKELVLDYVKKQYDPTSEISIYVEYDHLCDYNGYRVEIRNNRKLLPLDYLLKRYPYNFAPCGTLLITIYTNAIPDQIAIPATDFQYFDREVEVRSELASKYPDVFYA